MFRTITIIILRERSWYCYSVSLDKFSILRVSMYCSRLTLGGSPACTERVHAGRSPCSSVQGCNYEPLPLVLLSSEISYYSVDLYILEQSVKQSRYLCCSKVNTVKWIFSRNYINLCYFLYSNNNVAYEWEKWICKNYISNIIFVIFSFPYINSDYIKRGYYVWYLIYG